MILSVYGMKMVLLHLLGTLTILIIVSADSLFPDDQEIVYRWKAYVSVGSVLPQKLMAQWDLNANLRVQMTKNITNFKLTDIVSSESSIQSDITSLYKPFQALYINGELTELNTEAGDRLWSVNIKRALAGLLQLKLKDLHQPSFTTQELGLYGNCRAEYIVTTGINNTKIVRKILDSQSCWHHPAKKWANSPQFICPNNYLNEITSHSERVYRIHLDSPVVIKNISAKGLIQMQPYQAQAEAHLSLISQMLTLVSTSPISDIIKLDGEKQTVDLIYKEPLLDPTYGQPPDNKTSIRFKIEEMLAEFSDSLWWEVGSRGLNNETVFRLIDLMWWLDLKDWEALYSSVTLGTSYKQETIQHLFWELVPEVGSHDSAIFIRNLVKSGRVKGLLAGRLLVNFPFKQRSPSEDLLTQYEELLHLGGEIGEDVRNSAVLSFSTLIHKTCTKECKVDTIDRYAKLYLDRFSESSHHERQMLYLQGLSNMELVQVLDYLAPVISGQNTQNKHIRFLAIWAVTNAAYTNPGKVSELFWPLLTNRSESLEIRVASLTLLILSNPSPARLISLYWYMQTESCQQLYNFYYTSIKSLSSTTYPCYAQMGAVASQVSRFVRNPTPSSWATGNYVLDYEDTERGYGGLLQLLLIASETTGLPNVFVFMTEQHSLGVSSKFMVYLKVEGLAEGIKRQLKNITASGSISFPKLLQLLKGMKAPVKSSEHVHLELILKIDGRTVITQYLNDTTFDNLANTVKRLSSIYFEFSVNYQTLKFPLMFINSQPTDIGTPALVQVRSGSLISARGTVSQDNEGRARNAELDLRFSWYGISSLRLFSPVTNMWYGGDRSRSLHIRLPFAVQAILNFSKSYFKVVTIRHRDFAAGSRLGIVWHATSKLLNSNFTAVNMKVHHNLKDEWKMDSEDLGARLGASVFNCPGSSTISDALHLLKRAFLTKNKNYQMVPGGVALLGLFSLKEHLSFQPPGSSCGLMLSFTPLLNQVEPALVIEGSQVRLSMTRVDGMLWEIQAGLKQLLDGNKELTFKLYHAPSVSVTTEDIWRVIQFEGAFVFPSSKAGVFHPPAPLTGYTFVSWGDSAPTHADKAAVVDIKVVPELETNQTTHCTDFSPKCLQAVSEMATRQTAIVQYVNLPMWLIMAGHALFPEHIQTESTSTKVGFHCPTPFPPWNRKGLCAVNRNSVLTLDNTTLSTSLSSCFTVAVADCSHYATFIILVKKATDPKYIATKIYSGEDIIELLPNSKGIIDIFVNENTKLQNISAAYEYGSIQNGSSPLFIISPKEKGVIEVELQNGVVVQHYAQTVVCLVPSAFRGVTCGLCADFNSEISNEPARAYTQC